MTIPKDQQIGAELKLAFESLDAAEDDLTKNRLRPATSRGYYAIFQAARAVLWAKALAPKTHKGVARQFGLHVVQAGILPVEYSDILKDAADQRELADYHAVAEDFDRADVGKLIQKARQFVERIDRLLHDAQI